MANYKTLVEIVQFTGCIYGVCDFFVWVFAIAVAPLPLRLTLKLYRSVNVRNPQLGKYAANDDSGKLTNLNIEDGSFLRLAEVGVSYRFRFRKGFLHGMNLGLSAHNLFVVTKYTGWDPEVSSFGASSKRIGIDNGSYPNSRSFSFDVKFQF